MKLNGFVFIVMYLSSCLLSCFADEASINLQYQTHDNHLEHFLPADMPGAYFDSDEMEVIIEADGFADYYVVNIISQVTMQSVIYTQIGGYGDSIDISSLPDAYYRIVITSSNNNVYEGYFLWEQE